MIALVTGASSGIGEATARRLAREPGARLVLVARREERLRALADELGGATVIAADLTDADAPARIAAVVEAEHGRLDLLVNNAGAAWRATFADGGWENVRRHMELNFDAQVRADRGAAAAAAPRRRRARSSTSRARPGASRAAAPARTRRRSSRSRAGPTRCTSRRRAHGVHVGLVLPGFVATEGFPQRELVERALTRWIVSTPERVAEAIVDAGPGRQGRALRAAAVLARGGRAGRRAAARAARARRRRRQAARDDDARAKRSSADRCRTRRLRYEVAARSRRSRSTSRRRATPSPTRCSASCSARSRQARDDDGVRCVVLASTHATVFSSGGDLARFATRRHDALPAPVRAHRASSASR